MSKCYNSLRDDLIRTADDKEYRHAYAEESLNISIATQIKVLREQRKMSQDALAEESGMKQPVISRYENVNYASWSISSLRRLAQVFDVDLQVRFRSFGELVESVDKFSRSALQVPSFADDPYFKFQQPTAAPQLLSDITTNLNEQQSRLPNCGLAGSNVGSANSAAGGTPLKTILTGTQRA